MSGELAIALAAALILAAVAAAVIAVRTRRVVATPTERMFRAPPAAETLPSVVADRPLSAMRDGFTV